MVGERNELPLDEYRDVVRTIALTTELVVLDEAWTREATAASEPVTRDDDRVEQLSSVVDRLDELYAEIGVLAPRLGEIFRSRDALLRERYEALTADDVGDRPPVARTRSLTADERRKLRAFVEERGRGDILELVTNAAYEVAARSGAERQNLRAEYGTIRGGGTSEGDMDPDFEFWLQAVALAATLALGPEAGGVVELVGGIISWLVG
jgi:hypothetical protein